jgi:penicillin-binding protein 1A
MDQVRGYATIARMGVPVSPVYLTRVLRDDGSVVGLPGERPDLEWPRLPGGSLPRVLPAGVAYELADVMREVVERGTARKAFRPDRDRAGKTGTTNGYVDAWFVGFTPRYTVGVWIGTDGTQPLGDKETGGRAALPAWIDVVEALDDEPGARFEVPDEALLAEVGGRWLGFRRGAVPARVLAAPRPGPEPLPLLFEE